MTFRRAAVFVMFVASSGFACSLAIDTSGLSTGSEPSETLDGSSSSDGARDGGAVDGPSSDVTKAPDVETNAACSPQGTSCLNRGCCAGLHCGDERKCLQCLPIFDDCTLDTQCCTGKCQFTVCQ